MPKLHRKARETSHRLWKCSRQVTWHPKHKIRHKMMNASVTQLCIPIHERSSYIIHDAVHKYSENSLISRALSFLWRTQGMWAVDGKHQTSAVTFAPPWHQDLYRGAKSVASICNQEVTACFVFISCKLLATQAFKEAKQMAITWPHTDNQTSEWLWHYGWEVMDLPPHSSQLTQNDFHRAGLLSDLQQIPMWKQAITMESNFTDMPEL
jgi:hypothetical protein